MERDTGDILTVLEGGHKTEHYSVSTRFSYDDGLILTGSDDGNTVWYDIVKGKVIKIHQTHQNTVSSVDISPKKTSFITGIYLIIIIIIIIIIINFLIIL